MTSAERNHEIPAGQIRRHAINYHDPSSNALSFAPSPLRSYQIIIGLKTRLV